MPTSTQGKYEFAGDFRKIGFICRGDVGIAPYAVFGELCKIGRIRRFVYSFCSLARLLFL